MAHLSHKARRYGYRLKQRFREDPFSTVVLYMLFFAAVFLVFAFRGMIATVFIKPIGIINPGHTTEVPTIPDVDYTAPTADTPVEVTSENPKTDTTAPTPPVTDATPGNFTIHKVKTGETLSSIAADAGLDWKDVAGLNGLTPPYALDKGQEIKLPSPTQ